MATGTLTGQTIANTYKALLKITGTTAGGETLHATTLKVIEDGDGNPTPIQLAQNRIEIVPTANHANAFEVSQADGTQIFNINSTTPGFTINAATVTLTQDTDFVTSGGVNGMSIDGTTFSVDGTNNNVGIGITPNTVNKLQIKQASDINLGVRGAVDVSGAVCIQAVNDAVDTNIPLEYRASKHCFPIGNVGIGASPDSATKLLVDHDQNAYTRILVKNTDTGTSAQSVTHYETSAGLFICGAVSDEHSLDGSALLWHVPDKNMVFATNNNQRMTIQNDGNVGIGTDSPANLIHLDGNLTSNGDFDALLIESAQGSANSTRMFLGSRYNSDENERKAMIKVEKGTTGTIEGDLLLDVAKVGIGTASPAAFLEVSGGGASGATMIVDNTPSPNRMAELRIDGDNGSGDGGAMVSLYRDSGLKWSYYTRNNTVVGSAFSFALLDAGNDDGVYINQGGSGWTDASDERLKTSFVPIENAVDKLNTLQAINFKWKYGSEERQTKNNIGLLAQEVYEVFPEAVDYHDPDDFKLIDHPTIEGTKQAQSAWGIDKSKLIPVLVKAVQELSEQNTALKSRIEALENA